MTAAGTPVFTTAPVAAVTAELSVAELALIVIDIAVAFPVRGTPVTVLVWTVVVGVVVAATDELLFPETMTPMAGRLSCVMMVLTATADAGADTVIV